MDFVLGALVFFSGVMVGAAVVHTTIASTRTPKKPITDKD